MSKVPTAFRRLASIDACRGAAALSVLMFHVLIWLLRPGDHLSVFGGHLGDQLWVHGRIQGASSLTFGLGFLGVQLFFVISGFCIHAAYVNVSKIDRRKYVVRRFLRVYPLYFVVVVALFALYMFVGPNSANGALTWRNFIGHLFFWHYEGPADSAGRGISEVLWTISLEVQFYIIYALVGFSLIKRFGAGRIAMIWIAADIGYRIFWYTAGHSFGWHLVFSPERLGIFRFGEWMMGAWLAELVFGRGEAFTKSKFKPAADFAIGTAIILAGVLVGGIGNFEGDVMDVPGAVGFFFIVRGLVRSEFRRTLWTGKVPSALGYMGDRCYTLYLTHLTVVGAIAGGMQRLSAHYDWINWPAFGRASILSSLTAIALAILLSIPIYRYVELPSHQLARRLCSGLKSKRVPTGEGAKTKIA